MFLGYCRVSTQDQAADNRTSLAEQERILRGLAMVHGVERLDTDIYRDAGVSGAVPLRFRPEGKKLLAQMKPGDIVAASKLDRMFRSASDALICAEQMKEAGISLILMDMGSDPVTGTGMSKCFFTMAAAFAELERSTIAQRMQDGKKAKKAKGGHVGGLAPYGMRIVGHDHDAKIEIDENEQEVVRLITRLRARGELPAKILRRLNKDGFHTRTGKPFQVVQIQRIIAYQKALQ